MWSWQFIHRCDHLHEVLDVKRNLDGRSYGFHFKPTRITMHCHRNVIRLQVLLLYVEVLVRPIASAAFEPDCSCLYSLVHQPCSVMS